MKKNSNYSEVIKYTVAGVIFGSVFPLLSTAIEIIEHGLPRNLSSFIIVQRQDPLLWIIDSALLVVGFFGYQAGIRQQKLLDQAEHLEDLVNERSNEILRQKIFYEALVENNPIAIVTLDPLHNVVSVNPAFEAIFGYHTQDLMGKNLDDLVGDPEKKQEAYDITKGVLTGKTMREFGKRQRKDGTLVDVEILGEPIMINGKQIGVLGLYRDITEEKRAKEELQASEERFRRMFMESPVALRLEDFSKIKRWAEEALIKSGKYFRDFLVENPDEFAEMCKQRKIISLNSAALSLFHAKDQATLEANICSILSMESRNEQIDIICALLEGETTIEKEMVYESLDGKIVYAITKLSILPGFESDWSRVLFSNMDITERKLSEERLSYISLHDMITGVYNRSFFEEEMKRMESSRVRPISILISDMDNLKNINDLHGHQAGDAALQNIANIYKECFRAEDIIARIGGDEFAVLLPNVDIECSQNVKQRVLDQIKAYNQSNGEKIPLSISIGCATANKGDLLAEVFKVADESMYEEKQKKKQGKKRRS